MCSSNVENYNRPRHSIRTFWRTLVKRRVAEMKTTIIPSNKLSIIRWANWCVARANERKGEKRR